MPVMLRDILGSCTFGHLVSLSVPAMLHLMPGVRIVFWQLVLVFRVVHGIP